MSKDIIVKLACGCGASIAATYPVGFNPWELGRWLDVHSACHLRTSGTGVKP